MSGATSEAMRAAGNSWLSPRDTVDVSDRVGR